MKTFSKVVGWGLLALIAVFVVAGVTTDGRSDEQMRKECAAAMMSSIGTSTLNYADKKAYNDHVRDKCSGFSINGKPVAP